MNATNLHEIKGDCFKCSRLKFSKCQMRLFRPHTLFEIFVGKTKKTKPENKIRKHRNKEKTLLTKTQKLTVQNHENQIQATGSTNANNNCLNPHNSSTNHECDLSFGRHEDNHLE